jgi:hypothetical protein
MRSFTRFIFLTAIIFSVSRCAMAQGIRGHISNEKGEPLSYATIYISETKTGTSTNLKGEYELPLNPGTYTITFQYLGYTPISHVVMVGNDFTTKDIVLTEQIYQMPEVIVRASEKDRAVYIMRKAIGMAPYHLNQVKEYKAEVYIKGGWGVNKMPRILMKQMNATANQVAIKEGDYYFTESVNIITFNAPDKYVHEVVSSRTTMPVGDTGASPMDFIQASFYQPVIVNMAISPLAPNAFSHYDFRFMGATRQGDFIINKIQVIPKRESQQLFRGFIYIVSDDWAIQSLDLSNKNMAGVVKLKELYMPVEKSLWMPVSYEFNMDISMFGIKAVANYSSSVKYTEVIPDKSITATAVATDEGIKETNSPEEDKKLKEIESILSKEQLSSSDMVRLSKLNEKSSKSKKKEPLEVVDKTKLIIDPDASKKDSTYWEKIRPIPLTDIERLSVLNDTIADSLRKGNNTLVLSIGKKKANNDKEKSKSSKAMSFTKAVVMGTQWKFNDTSSITFNGLARLKALSFNTVDGFAIGTGFTWMCKTGKTSRIFLNPSAKYAFNRQAFMWNINSGYNFNSMKQSFIGLRFGSLSKDFAPSGVSPLLNTYSSLFLKYNWMKLYQSTHASVSYRSEIVNGLKLGLSASWEKRGVLENKTTFSLLKPDRDYTPNIPPNPFVNGEVAGYDAMIPVNHSNVSFAAELSYTPRQRYRITNNIKVNLEADYPTFHIYWKHGYNYNDTLSGHFDLLRGDISMHRNLGALREFRWNIGGGGFFRQKNLQIQDMYIFNTQSSMVLLNNYEDAFYLKPNYAIASPSQFAEAHLRYTSPCLLVKRLPLLSKTLIRENVSASWLWTPDYGNYYEAGYSLSEIYLVGEAGVYAGFRNTSFDSFGFRFVFIFN